MKINILVKCRLLILRWKTPSLKIMENKTFHKIFLYVTIYERVWKYFSFSLSQQKYGRKLVSKKNQRKRGVRGGAKWGRGRGIDAKGKTPKQSGLGFSFKFLKYAIFSTALCTSTVHDQSANICIQRYLRILWNRYYVQRVAMRWHSKNLS